MPAFPLQIGVGLWSMRSTAYAPRSWTSLYAELRDDALIAEDLGYDALWIAEHHFWYDGWCPQPLVAAASVLGGTQRIRVGTGMHLLPQHDVGTISRDVGWLIDCFGDRLDLGVSLGYRDEEYDAVGIARSRRGQLMGEHLDHLLGELSGRWASPPPVYVGGIAEPAIRRAGARGLSILLPNSLSPAEVAARSEIAETEADAAGRPKGRTGVLVDVWLCQDDAMAGRVRDRLVVHYREYSGAWFRLRGELGFARPDLLDKQSARTRDAVVVGTASQVLAQLLELRHAGADTLVLQIRADFSPTAYRAVMAELAHDVLPQLRDAA